MLEVKNRRRGEEGPAAADARAGRAGPARRPGGGGGMRALIVGGGCRGLDLTRALAADGHAARVVTRTEAGRAAIEAAGGECWIGDPDVIGTLRYALENVTLVFWLLGTASGADAERLAALHGSRLKMMLEKTTDTTVRGVDLRGRRDRRRRGARRPASRRWSTRAARTRSRSRSSTPTRAAIARSGSRRCRRRSPTCSPGRGASRPERAAQPAAPQTVMPYCRISCLELRRDLLERLGRRRRTAAGRRPRRPGAAARCPSPGRFSARPMRAASRGLGRRAA